MAVRRISDLPNLFAYYADADLKNSLIEVSYTANPNDPKSIRRYQSFYANMNDMLAMIINGMTRASKTKFGIVKIGDNIDVVTNDTTHPMSNNNNGLISVKTASYNDRGVAKIAQNTGLTIANGTLSASKASTSQLGVVKVNTSNGLSIDANGSLSVNKASKNNFGVVKVSDGNGLSIVDGTISFDPGGSSGVVVTPKTSDGTLIAEITVNNVPKQIFNGVDINQIINTVVGEFIPNYSAQQEFTVPCGNNSNAEISNPGWRSYFPTCRITCNCNAYMVLEQCYGITNATANEQQGGIARSCTVPTTSKGITLNNPWLPLPNDIRYCTGYFIPANKRVFIKCPKFKDSSTSRRFVLCPLGTASLQAEIEVRRYIGSTWQKYNMVNRTWTNAEFNDWDTWCAAN